MELYAIRGLLSQGKRIYDLPLRVTFYARVSTDREDQLNSLENQVTYFEEFIKNNTNWTYVKGYWDEGISGTSTNKRDDFNRMIIDAHSNMFDLIVTKEVSRFARDTIDSLSNTRDLLNYNVGVYFMSDNINTLEPDSELRLTIMSSIAQEEVRKLSERVRFGKKRSREKGIVNGNDNFWGYNKDKFKKGRLVIDEESEFVVKLAFELYDALDIGTIKLGHLLYNDYGIKSKTGKPLAGAVLARMFRNPKYKGFYCANKEATVDYRTKKRILIKPEEWLVYKDPNIPIIIEEDLWERVNKKLDKNSAKHQTKVPGNTTSRYPFSGRLFCYHDKASYIRGSYLDRKTKTKKIFWGCSNYRKYGRIKKEGCNSPVIYLSEFEEVCRNIIKDILKNQDGLLNEIYDVLEDSKSQAVDERQKKLCIKKLKELEEQKNELIGMRLRKEVDTTEYNNYKNKIDKDINEYSEKLNELNDIKNQEKEQQLSLEQFKNKVSKLVLEEENCLSIAETLFKKIEIETINEEESENKKAILHIELNINSYKERNFSLDQLLLLFCNSDRCCCCYG